MPPSFEKNYCPYCGEDLSSRKIEGVHRNYCESCERVIWRNAEPVSATIVEKGDKILFVKRGIEPEKGKWSLPAGFLEYGEQPEKGAVRELEEETSLKANLEDLEMIDALNMRRFPGQRLLATVFRIDYQHTEGGLKAGDDAVEASFWNMDQLKEDQNEELKSHFVDVIEGF